MSDKQAILRIRNLNVTFIAQPPYHALKDVSFDVHKGRTLAVVGPSGSGKSVTSLALMGLLPSNASITGNIDLVGTGDLLQIEAGQFRQIRGKEIAMVFQEPMSALNPLKTCGKQLVEALQTHQPVSAKSAKAEAIEWFKKVHLPKPEQLFYRYPHQLSGGQKQRVTIAMAMCNHPSLLIADEPTTALDVTVQKEIILLMKALQDEFGTAILFITHDLALAATIADHYLIMEKGQIKTTGSVLPEQKDFTLPAGLSTDNKPLLALEHVSVYFPEQRQNWGKPNTFHKAVDDVSFQIFEGETLGLVGESGCGKSTLSKGIMGLLPFNKGNIIFDNENITHYGQSKWRKLRKEIQIIFQDPFSSLNQRLTVGSALAEPIRVHGLADGQNVDKLVDELLIKVQLPVSAKNKYPHEFSGGQRQRICIARALAVQPRLLICDESVSALDIIVREQILELLARLQKTEKLTYLFITHDLNVVKRISNRIIVMRNGKIVEQGLTGDVMNFPKEEYTRTLLLSTP